MPLTRTERTTGFEPATLTLAKWGVMLVLKWLWC
jgi:hypothetical protein